ncbi:MAG: exodeoxyribonuclease V subunit gamma [Ilumatobacteraceae bacterium]
MIRLHHADDLEPLLDELARVVGVPTDDPFVPELVIVPSLGMRDAVVAGLARRVGASSSDLSDGVMANVEFEFPGRFIGRAFGDAARPDQLSGDPWHVERLSWAVLDVLSSSSVRLPRQPESTELWSFSRSIADLFDRYAIQRPRMIRHWANGGGADGSVAGGRDEVADTDGTYLSTGDGRRAPLLADHSWQPALWRAVRARIGVSSPPELMPSMLAHIRAGEITVNLPQRVCLFGFGSLSTGMLDVATAISASRDVHAFLRHPSAVAWHGSPHQLAGAVQPRQKLDVASHTSHPLVSSWGRLSLEAVAIVSGSKDIEHVAAAEPPAPAPTTVLRAVQHGIRLDVSPAPAVGVDANDGSVQVHACHGDVRQLEALRDALGHAFVADPTLAAHDVVIVSPRIEDFAPLIESVFSRGALSLPVRIGDRSLSTADPLGDALVAVLDTVSGRATLSDVLGVVQHAAVRDRLGWDAESVERAASWAADLGARWGFDAGHRRAWGLPADVDTGTWRSLVDRLLLGIAMPAATPRIAFGGLSPHDDIGTDDAVVAGGLADLISRLASAHDLLSGRRPIDSWIAALHEIVDLLLVESSDEPWGRRMLHRTLDSILAAATIGESACAVDLEVDDVIRLVRRAIADRPGRIRLRTGSITATSMLPVQGVPARVVCILGLDDGALRSGTFEGDDILGVNPCIGERHPRFESRQLLLDAVLTARDRLIITCTGADLTTNKDVPFVVPLVELLDVVGAVTGAGERVVVRHPRHGFNERALIAGALSGATPQPFTFDASMLEAAMARRSAATSDAGASSRWLLDPQVPDTFDIDLLAESVARPARVYLRRRLDVRLPSDPSQDEDGLSIGVDPLSNSALGRSLLDALRRNGTGGDWRSAARQDGTLPPAALGDHALDRVDLEVEAMAALAQHLGVPLAGGAEQRVEVGLIDPAAGPRSTTQIDGVIGSVHAADEARIVVDIDYRRPKSSHRLSLAVRLAAAHLADPERQWSGILITRGESGMLPRGLSLALVGDGADRNLSAVRILTMATHLATWSLRDAVPLFDTASELLASGRIADAANSLESDFVDAYESMLWPDRSLAAVLEEPVAASDPQPVQAEASASGSGRAMATARWVWGAYAAAVTETATDVVAVHAAAEGGDD